MSRLRPPFERFTLLLLAASVVAGCSGGGGSSSPAAPAVSASAATWFIPEGSILTATQMANFFDAKQLYFNVPSAANSNGEIRGEISPAPGVFLTDTGDPFAQNPANSQVTFAAILGGDQVKPRNVVTRASGYGSVTLNPQTKQLSGFIATSGIVGTAAYINDGLPGTNGAIALTLEGGPVVWTIPANTVLTDAQAARLSAGAYYFNVQSNAIAGGEIRGQLNQQVRFASLKGSSEVPPVATTATGAGFLALNPSTRQLSGFVKVAGVNSSVISALIHIGAAGTNGSSIVALNSSGNGTWTVPINTVLSSFQVANFNNSELYFNIHTVNNSQGELRGQIITSSIRIGTANLAGAKEIPPVSTQATGTGIMAWNVVTEEVTGTVTTDKVNGTEAHVHSGDVATTGPLLFSLTTTSPVTAAPSPGISFALDVQPIFNTSCAISACHVTGSTAPMSLEAGSSFASLVNLVVPGNSATSYLLRRLNGDILPRMPLNRAPLSATDLDLIRKWIDTGALNN
jgi:CHRD domain-containing protein